MAKAAMAELVSDHRQDLRLARPLDERVEEHDAPRRAEPGDVRVQLRRPAARIGDEHLANRHARAIRKPEHGIPKPGVLEGPEAVEHGFEHDGRDEAEQEDEERGSDSRQREARPKERRGRSRRGRQTQLPVSTAPIVTPFRRSSANAAADCREKPNRRSCRSPSQTESGRRTSAESNDEERAEQERAESRRQGIDDPDQVLTGGRERERRRHGQPEQDVGEDDAVARVVIAADARHALSLFHVLRCSTNGYWLNRGA